MNLTEMRDCAERTLEYFFEVMPDIPFGMDDIIFDFAPPSRMATRYKALCAEYRPKEIILKEHEEQLGDGTGGQAIVGEDKSAVLICTKQPFLKANLRRIIFHELVHIYCAKTETDGEHFVDIYGSGKPYDENDEILCDGYFTWSEFIADYLSHIKTKGGKLIFEYGCRDDVSKRLDEVVIGIDSRRDFEWVCNIILTAYEPEKVGIIKAWSFLDGAYHAYFCYNKSGNGLAANELNFYVRAIKCQPPSCYKDSIKQVVPVCASKQRSYN